MLVTHQQSAVYQKQNVTLSKNRSKGLVSIGRSEAVGLLSTTPRLRPKSSTNDFARGGYRSHCTGGYHFGPRTQCSASEDSRLLWPSHRGPRRTVDRRISLPAYEWRGKYCYRYVPDSDLVAFSHNPPALSLSVVVSFVVLCHSDINDSSQILIGNSYVLF